MAIENARLYAAVRRNEARIEKELRFAQRVQAALMPELPKVAGASTWRDGSSRRASSAATSTTCSRRIRVRSSSAVGDVSGKGAPAALYGAFAAELVRSRTLRRRFTPDRFSVPGVLQSMNTHPARARARGVLLHAVLCVLRSRPRAR